MPFMKSNGNVTSFASYQDVVDRDQRLFEVNEGLTEDILIPILKRTTERILSMFRSSTWWKDYYRNRDSTIVYLTDADIPALDANKVLDRKNDFTDLCVYQSLAEYVLPKVADFGSEDNAERQKMAYYVQKADKLFMELVKAGDWYDFDDSGTISTSEKSPGVVNLKRVR